MSYEMKLSNGLTLKTQDSPTDFTLGEIRVGFRTYGEPFIDDSGNIAVTLYMQTGREDDLFTSDPFGCDCPD